MASFFQSEFRQLLAPRYAITHNIRIFSSNEGLLLVTGAHVMVLRVPPRLLRHLLRVQRFHPSRLHRRLVHDLLLGDRHRAQLGPLGHFDKVATDVGQ